MKQPRGERVSRRESKSSPGPGHNRVVCRSYRLEKLALTGKQNPKSLNLERSIPSEGSEELRNF